MISRANNTVRNAHSLIVATLTLHLALGSAHGKELEPPFDPASQRALIHEGTPPQACPTTDIRLPPLMPSVNFYVDPPTYSRVDPVLEREFYAATAPIRNSEEAIAIALTNFVKSDTPNSGTFADCVLAHLLRFARDNAMVETTEWRASGQVRLFGTTPPFAYAILRDNYSISDEHKAQIEGWIRRLANSIRTYVHEAPYRNNIDYWAAAALASAAVALQDKSFLEDAINIALTAADEVTADGLLPKEMNRGDRALEYSLFATQALAVVIAIAERNGIQTLTKRNDSAVLRLMSTLARAIADPDSFVALSRNPATVAKERVYTQNFAWIALARRFVTDPAVAVVYCQNRKLYAFRAGGDWAVFFGDPNACSR